MVKLSELNETNKTVLVKNHIGADEMASVCMSGIVGARSSPPYLVTSLIS